MPDTLKPDELVFEGVAKRKLDDLLARGWQIGGYSLIKDGEIGLITMGGFVGWFTVAEQNGEAARNNFLTMQGSAATLLKRATTAEAALVKARVALERIMRIVTYPADTSIQPRGFGVRSTDITGCELIAEIARLALSDGEEDNGR